MDSVAVSIKTSALRQRVVNALAVTGLEVSAVTGPGTADAPVAIVESCELLAWQTSASRHAELIAVVHGEQDPVLGSAADLTEVVGIVDRDDMDEVLARASGDVGRTFRVRERRHQSPDHPIRAGFPESLYLKCQILESCE